VNFVQQYWYLGIAFSVVYTALSVAWSVRVERRISTLKQQLRVLELSLEYVERDIAQLQSYLEKTPTGRFKTPTIRIIPKGTIQ
jgi:hypothetical protein